MRADVIKKALKIAGLSQQDLANELGWSRETVSRKLSRDAIDQETIRAVSKLTGIPENQLEGDVAYSHEQSLKTRLKHRLYQHGVSYEALGQELGISRQAVSNFLNRDGEKIKLSYLNAIGKLTGCATGTELLIAEEQEIDEKNLTVTLPKEDFIAIATFLLASKHDEILLNSGYLFDIGIKIMKELNPKLKID